MKPASSFLPGNEADRVCDEASGGERAGLLDVALGNELDNFPERLLGSHLGNASR
jgi:hypothetical protein